MKRKLTVFLPKYAHYFLASLLLDCVGLFFVGQIISVPFTYIILLIWAFSQVVYYPKVSIRRYANYSQIIRLTVKQLLLFTVLLFLFNQLYQSSLTVVDLVSLIGVLLLSKTLFVYLVGLYRKLGFGYNNFMLLGDTHTMNSLSNYLLAKKKFAGHRLLQSFAKIESLEAVKAIIEEGNLNEIYCSSSVINDEQLVELLSLSYKAGLHFYIVSDDGKTDSSQSFIANLFNSNLKSFPLLDQKNLLLKRFLDLVVSILVILLILPWLTLLIGVFIKLDSKGPVFFKQPRAGKNGKYFLCLKFRSMRVTTNHELTSENDERITKIGQFIRKTSIDEIPQFINVFTGYMSVVGPRPHVKFLDDQYIQQIDKYQERLLVKPGITGLSQISGHRGNIESNKSMSDRIRTDLLYIENWSVLLDIRIILKTMSKNIFFVDQQAY